MKLKWGNKTVAEADSFEELFWVLKHGSEFEGALVYPHVEGTSIDVRLPDPGNNTYGEAIHLRVEE